MNTNPFFASIEYIKNFSTNPEVINKINELIAKNIEFQKSISPNAQLQRIKINVNSVTAQHLRNFVQNNFNDDQIISDLQSMITTLNRQMPRDVGIRGGLKRRNKKSNKKSRKSNKKSRKSNKKSRKN